MIMINWSLYGNNERSSSRELEFNYSIFGVVGKWLDIYSWSSHKYSFCQYSQNIQEEYKKQQKFSFYHQKPVLFLKVLLGVLVWVLNF